MDRGEGTFDSDSTTPQVHKTAFRKERVILGLQYMCCKNPARDAKTNRGERERNIHRDLTFITQIETGLLYKKSWRHV